MYVLSWIFLGAAIGTLAYGLTQPGLTFIYVSIVASVVAMLFLLAGVLRKRPVQPATAGAPYGPTPEEAAARSADTAPVTTVPAERREAATRPVTPAQRKPATDTRPRTPAPSAAEVAEAAPAKRTTAGKKTTKPAAKKPAAKKPAAKKPAAAKASSGRTTTARVVAIPERGTYHESECRFVKGRTDTERLAKATAKRRGYSACGVCKPG